MLFILLFIPVYTILIFLLLYDFKSDWKPVLHFSFLFSLPLAFLSGVMFELVGLGSVK